MMFQIRRALALFLAVLIVAGGAFFFAPGVDEAEAAPNGCGPSVLQLYTLIPNQITYWHFWYGTEVFDFTQACNTHDQCYSSSGISRSTCDRNFLNDMLSVCSQGWTWNSRTYCSAAAYTYYGSVASFGWIAYEK